MFFYNETSKAVRKSFLRSPSVKSWTEVMTSKLTASWCVTIQSSHKREAWPAGHIDGHMYIHTYIGIQPKDFHSRSAPSTTPSPATWRYSASSG